MELLHSSDWRKIVRPGSRVFIGSGAGVPFALVESLLAHHEWLRDVELVHIHTLGPTPWIDPKYASGLRANTFFLTPEVARAVREGRADYTPASMSEVPKLFRSTVLPVDVALISISPPDAEGKVTLGVSVDVVRAAVDSARVVVAQVNHEMPQTHGQGEMHVSEIDWYIKQDAALPEFPAAEEDAVRLKIGAYLAELIDDGSTLQVGIGLTPRIAITALKDHRHLGIHTGMFSDGLMDLIRCGAVDNSRKGLMPGKSMVSHALGSHELYQFVNDNPDVVFRSSEWVNDPGVISRNERMVAINGARQIDITGQVVRDSTGHHFYGGIGAQLDFLRGAAASVGGRPVHLMPSTSSDGTRSRVVANLEVGSGVATGRTDVHYIITEYGVASMRGRSIRERALEMIQIAHPDFREELMRGAHEKGWLPTFISTAPASLRPEDSEAGVDLRRLNLGKEQRGFFLRPLHPADMRRLQEFFYSHSEETIRQRYGYLRDAMPADSAYALVAVDQTKDLALGVFEERGAGGEIELRAVGRYYRDEKGEGAEIAFVVHEEARRLGLASILLEELAEVARKRGIRMFWAEVLSGNREMLGLFKKFGAVNENSHDTEGFICRLEVAEILKRAKKFATQRKNTRKSETSVDFKTGWFWSEECLAHDTGPGHVETPERYRVLGEALAKAAGELNAVALPGREATRAELLRCHAAHYLDIVHIDVDALADRLRTGDTPLCPESENVAKLAVGAGLEAVDAVMEGRVKRAFVAVRPPGHHATPERGMGFCIYNNVALMARHAQEIYGCGRVLIVDWDVHHGNGTQDIFFSDPSVFYFSFHQSGVYPYTGSAEETGAGPGVGTTLNFPLPIGSGIAEVLPLIEGDLATAMESFQPELVLISAGFDSRIDDPIGDMTLKDDDFVTMTRAVAAIADRWASGRIISVLEGGYNPAGLASASVAHFRALAGRLS